MPPSSSSSSFSLLGIFKYIDSCLSLFLTHTHKQKEREKEYFWWSVSDRPSKPATTSKKLTNASLFSFYCLLISLVCLALHLSICQVTWSNAARIYLVSASFVLNAHFSTLQGERKLLSYSIYTRLSGGKLVWLFNWFLIWIFSCQ